MSKMCGIILYHVVLCCDEHEFCIFTDLLLFIFHDFVHEFCYGCEGFTHPLGREEKSRVKGLVRLENVFESLGVWAPFYAIIIHILLGLIREV